RLLQRLGGLLHRRLGTLRLPLSQLPLRLAHLLLALLQRLARLLRTLRLPPAGHLLRGLRGLLGGPVQHLRGLLARLLCPALVPLLALGGRLLHGGLGLLAGGGRLLGRLLRLRRAVHFLGQLAQVLHQPAGLLLQPLLPRLLLRLLR